jgi:hypothetical protein
MENAPETWASCPFSTKVSGDSIRGSELTDLSGNGPAPLTDDRQIVMGVVSKGPLSSLDLWTAICQRATTNLMSVYNNGCFLDDDGNECDLRFGIDILKCRLFEEARCAFSINC